MILMVHMKNVIRRGKTYHFRLNIPKDCVEAFGQTEIVQSLKTDDVIKAKAEADKLTKLWQMKIRERRQPIFAVALEEIQKKTVDIDKFRQTLSAHMEKGLSALFEKESSDGLRKGDTKGCTFTELQRRGDVSLYLRRTPYGPTYEVVRVQT